MAEEDANEKGKSILEKFREKYPDCLEGYVENVYVEYAESGIGEESVLQCSIRQAIVSKPKIVLLKTQEDLSIPPVGLTKGHRVSFFAYKSVGEISYDGILFALLNYNTGRTYAVGKATEPGWGKSKPLKWEDVQKPL